MMVCPFSVLDPCPVKFLVARLGLVLFKKCVVLSKKDVVWFCLKRKLRGKIKANFGPLKGENDDVYRAVRTINAMESLKVMPVRHEQFLVANM